MTSEEFKVILKSLGRIELLIKLMIEAKYGKAEGRRVYKEVTDLIDKELFKEDINNE